MLPRLFLLATLLLGGCFGGWSRFVPTARDGFVLRHAPMQGAPRPYYAHVPTTGAGPFPVVLFLHGGGESGESPARPTQVGLGPVVQARGGRFPFVVLFPQCPRGSSWTSPRAAAHALAVLDDALAHLPVDPARVYLVGNSMGGHGALRLGADHPERFAAVLAVAGRAGKATWYPTPRDAVEDLPADDPEAALAERLRALPVWLVHGDDDHITPVTASVRMARALEAEGAEVRLTLYPDLGHAAAWERAYADPTYFEWLLAHRR